MGERPSIAFRVEEETKNRWQAAVDDSAEYDSLSHLIRKGVEGELASDGPQSTSDGGASGEVLDAIERLEGQIGDVQRGVEAVEEGMRGEAVSDDARTTVFEKLEPSAMKAKSIDAVAEETDLDRETTALALTQLRESLGSVTVRPNDDGELLYYRTEGESYK